MDSLIIDDLERALRRYRPQIEDDDDEIRLYIVGVDDMSQRNFYNIESAIDAIADRYGLDYDVQNGYEWCWTFRD